MSTNNHLQMLRLSEVISLLGISRSSIYDKLNVKSPRYDASFPQPKKVGASAVRWRESDLEIWLESRI